MRVVLFASIPTLALSTRNDELRDVGYKIEGIGYDFIPKVDN